MSTPIEKIDVEEIESALYHKQNDLVIAVIVERLNEIIDTLNK